VKLPEKIEIFRKFAWKNRKIFHPDPRPLRFQTRLTPLVVEGTSIKYITHEGRGPRSCDSLWQKRRVKNMWRHTFEFYLTFIRAYTSKLSCV